MTRQEPLLHLRSRLHFAPSFSHDLLSLFISCPPHYRPYALLWTVLPGDTLRTEAGSDPDHILTPLRLAPGDFSAGLQPDNRLGLEFTVLF